MADYQDIRGLRVKYLSADPSVTVAGEVWYNSTTGTLKSQVLTESWSSGAAIATARSAMAGGGIPTAAWIAGGKTNNAPSNVSTAETEEYNGSGWSTGGTLPQGSRSFGEGAGPLTAGITVGGGPTTPLVGQTWVESYNGTSWTAETGTPLGLVHNSVFGLESAAVSAGRGPGTATPQVFNYDGSTWTVGGTMSLPRGYTTSAGIQTAGWIAGGWDDGGPPFDADEHEQYDGTSWTDAPVLNTGRSAGGGNGPQTSAIYFGGIVTPTSTTATETFDGSSWSTSPATLGTAVDEMGSANNGTSNSTALSVGGLVNNAHPQQKATQEYNKSANVITAGAWASATAYPFGAGGVAGFGTQTAAVGVGGESAPGPTVNTVAEYDGSSWTGVTAYPSPTRASGTTGILTAGLVVGGNTAPGATPTTDATGEYDGTNWSTGGVYPAVNSSVGVAGTQTAALGAGAYFTPAGSPGSTQANTYNGSSWASSPALNTARYQAGNSGTTTAALLFGGAPSAGTTVESFDGSSWTSLSNKIFDTPWAMTRASVATADTAANFAAAPPYANATELYDGTSWATGPALGTVRQGGGAGGPTSGLVFTGYSTSAPRPSATEEFTAGTTTANIVTLTTS